MLRDIYSIPEEETRYDDNALEVTDELDEIIQQVDLLLFTKKGEVLCVPEFGCNLNSYLFETSYNKSVIKNVIMEQINNFIYQSGTYNIDVDVNFVQWKYNVAMIVDLNINNKKVASYLV